MKKFTLMFAVCAACFSMQAEIPEAVEVPILNYSFEEVDPNTPDSDDHTFGWAQVRNEGVETSWTGRSYNKAHSQDPELVAKEGNWYVRMLETGKGVEPNNYIKQDVERPGAGVYALTADVQVTRNGQKGGLGENSYGFLFLGDSDSDIDDPEDPAFKIIRETTAKDGEGNFVQDYDWHPQFIVFKSEARRGDLTIAFGHPSSSEAISKGWFQCDSFKLYYYGEDADFDEIQKMYEDMYGPAGVDEVVVTPVYDNKYYNMQGIEVAEPTAPGLYIHNGKKILVK